ncbi:conserved hypothetical protein [Magnetospirillum sp. LM-5]|nr:conserved hypothetical protein [Magnetospirillum sp. LM-5]
MPNALHPDRMSTAERLDEVADILAAGLIRLKARKSRVLSADTGDSRLDLMSPPSGHALINRAKNYRKYIARYSNAQCTPSRPHE